MRLIVTGGGTGGHVLPALEVARVARDCGHEIEYVGSYRGQEAKACARAGVMFSAVQAVPLAKLYTPRGIISALTLLRATARARSLLRKKKADLVFSTGGYSASPYLMAAKVLGTSVVIHEQNTLAGRTHLIAAKFAKCKCVVFDEAKSQLGADCVRTGMPIRKELVEASKSKKYFQNGVCTLALGGSQGAAALNEAIFSAAMHINGSSNHWIHISGEKLYESAAKSADRLGAPPSYKIRPYLQTDEMATALRSADLAVARAGAGVIAELALFGIPMILLPYPSAYANHQYHNAAVIERIGGGVVISQSELNPEVLEREWRKWSAAGEHRERAYEALRSWSIPDAATRVYEQIELVYHADKSRN